MKEQLNIRTAAARMGVSRSTLKRLADENLVPSSRTPGGHRRFDLAELEIVAARLVGGWHAKPARFSSADQRRLEESLANGDSKNLMAILVRCCHSSDEFVDAIDRVLMPHLKMLSASQGAFVSYKTVLARECVCQVLDWVMLEYAVTKRWQALALGCSMQSDTDRVTAKAVEFSFAAVPMRTHFLGYGLSASSLSLAIRKTGVSNVWVSHGAEPPWATVFSWHEAVSQLLPTDCRFVVFGNETLTGLTKFRHVAVVHCSLNELVMKERDRMHMR